MLLAYTPHGYSSLKKHSHLFMRTVSFYILTISTVAFQQDNSCIPPLLQGQE